MDLKMDGRYVPAGTCMSFLPVTSCSPIVVSLALIGFTQAAMMKFEIVD